MIAGNPAMSRPTSDQGATTAVPLSLDSPSSFCIEGWMKVDLTDKGAYTLISTNGLLDESAKKEFDEHLHPIIAEGGRKLLVDLSGSERVSSAGIGHLVTLVSRANTKGSRVVLVNPTPFVRSIFHATRLTKFFEIADSTQAGIERLLGQHPE
jgi:anti-sigma B factor antagonist